MNTEQYMNISRSISTAEYETGIAAFQTKDAAEREVLMAAAELIEQAGKMIRQMKREQMAAAKVQAQS